MAHIGFIVVAFVWFFLGLTCVANGRDVHKGEVTKKKYQSRTVSHPPESAEFHHKSFTREGLTMDGVFSNIRQVDDNSNIIDHYATIIQEKGNYHGAQATLSTYGLPQVGSNQASAVNIWVVNGEDGSNSFNAIIAGWHVYQGLYGDYDTHFYVYWNVDGNKGCYNLKCEGFVPFTSSRYRPGEKIQPLSVYNGVQHDITLKISKDPKSGDWWLHAGPNADQPVGHWPKSLFTSLADGASQIQWGGIVSFPKGEPSPPMGSGHFPWEGKGKAAYLSNVRVVSSDGKLVYPSTFTNYQDDPSCYRVIKGNSYDDPVYFGGPGDCPN